MKNSFGQSITVSLFGESHGNAIGALIDGLAPGIPVDEGFIAEQLSRRRPSSAIDTARQEPDEFRILSGVFNGKTTGTPICIEIPNVNTRSRDYNYGPARPSHADYAAFCKYHGNEDYRGGGHFSGRITAALVAAGAIFISALRQMNITVGTHILSCGTAKDRSFSDVAADIEYLSSASFPVLNASAKDEMTQCILSAKEKLDSIGGITQTAVCGLPAGLGEPWFDSVEGLLSHAMFSIGGVKGIEFGQGFACADMPGSEFNDPLRNENGEIVSLSNNNGGINGGITNGMPIVFQCAVRPTASISQPQQTVNFLTGENEELVINGRHDPAIIRRICPVLDSMTAMVICDMLAGRYGTDIFTRGEF